MAAAKQKLRSVNRPVKSTAEAFEEVVQPERKAPGRKPSEEKMKYISFKIPVSRIERLKALSHLYGVNQTQIVLKLIDEKYDERQGEIEALAKILKTV